MNLPLLLIAASLQMTSGLTSTAMPITDDVSHDTRSAESLNELRSKALAGNSRAAYDLSAHYLANGNTDKAIHWAKLSANDGYCSAIEMMIEYSISKKRGRAEAYWQRRRFDHRCKY